MNENNKPLRELAQPSAGWIQVSLDIGRDEALCAIEDESIILSAAGLAIASMAACLSKDDDWLSRNEVLRAVIPGTKENKIEAAAALCEVGLWCEEERGGVPGWRMGVSTALREKRRRIENATNAANARYRDSKKKSPVEDAMEASEEAISELNERDSIEEETPF